MRDAGVYWRIRDRAARLIDRIPLGEEVDLVPLLSAPLPLLTLAGRSLASRMATSLLHAVGLTGTIASSAAE
mgnify:CR=1 FL=1